MDNQNNLQPVVLQDQLKTDMLQVDIATQMIQSPSFINMLDIIQQNVLRANQLLADYRNNPKTFVENNDEEDIEQLIKDVTEIKKVTTNVEETKKQIRKRFNDIRDNITHVFDDQINQYHFKELTQASNDLKQLKKDMEQTRANERWLEIQSEFEMALSIYPIIQKLAPQLTDFNQFKLRHPKLVSGAKTRNVTKNDKLSVKTEIDQWNNDLLLIEANDWQLESTFHAQLLQAYISDPQSYTVSNQAKILKEKQDQQNALIKQKMEEQKRLEEERKRQEELKKQQEELKRQQFEAEEIKRKQLEAQQLNVQPITQTPKNNAPQNQAPTQPIQQSVQAAPTPFPNTVAYLLNDPYCSQLATNPSAKVQALAVILANALKKEPNFVHQDTQNNPTQVLELVRYILNA